MRVRFHIAVSLGFLTILVWVCSTPAYAGAQSKQTSNSLRAQAAMKAGQDADAKQDYAAAMAAYRQVIELDPANVEAHKRFIMASWNQAGVGVQKLLENPDYDKLERGELHGKARKALEKQKKRAFAEDKAGDDALLATYGRWISVHPKMAVFYWAKGYASVTREKPTEEEKLYQKSISLDPKFAPAYNSMARIEYGKGDYDKQSEYLKRAMDLDPSSPEATRAYAESFQFTDSPKFRQLAEQYAERFPKSSECTYLLWQLENTEPSGDRISLLERMRHQYVDNPVFTVGMDEPDVFTGLLEQSMADLFNIYAKDSPQKALDLAREVQKQKWADPSWKDAVAYQQNLINAVSLIAAAKYSDASALLQHQFAGDILKYYLDHTPVTLAIAQAQAGAGNTQKAFDTLAAAWIKTPDPELKAGLLKYGSQTGKNAEQVDSAVWQKWTSNAKEMKPFELESMDGKKKISLSDFRGRVTLVSFWFPLCGPCRSELPYFGETARKYKLKGFVILAINGVPEQNRLAPGVLKQYDIIGLKVPSNKWAERYDHVSGYPTNYLLDTQGRIMAHPDVRSVDALKRLEAQINALLAQSAKDKSANSERASSM